MAGLDALSRANIDEDKHPPVRLTRIQHDAKSVTTCPGGHFNHVLSLSSELASEQQCNHGHVRHTLST